MRGRETQRVGIDALMLVSDFACITASRSASKTETSRMANVAFSSVLLLFEPLSMRAFAQRMLTRRPRGPAKSSFPFPARHTHRHARWCRDCKLCDSGLPKDIQCYIS